MIRVRTIGCNLRRRKTGGFWMKDFSQTLRANVNCRTHVQPLRRRYKQTINIQYYTYCSAYNQYRVSSNQLHFTHKLKHINWCCHYLFLLFFFIRMRRICLCIVRRRFVCDGTWCPTNWRQRKHIRFQRKPFIGHWSATWTSPDSQVSWSVAVLLGAISNGGIGRWNRLR